MTACPSCGAPAGVDDRFCARCGSTLVATPAVETPDLGFCTSCGQELDADDRFCGRCGAPVREGPAASGPSDEGDDDLLADWDLEVPQEEPPSPPAPQEAVTEQVPLPPRPRDTAVIERQPERRPAAPLPPPRPAREPRAPARGFPLGATIALVGAVAVIVSAILEWGGPFADSLPRGIAFRLLFDPQGPSSGPNLGVVVLGIGTLGALVALLTMAVPILTPLRRLIGLLTLAIPAGFAVRTFQLALGEGTVFDLPSLLGPGVYVAFAGAFVQLVAGKWFGR